MRNIYTVLNVLNHKLPSTVKVNCTHPSFQFSMSTQEDETGDAPYTHGTILMIAPTHEPTSWVSDGEAEELYVEVDASKVTLEEATKMFNKRCGAWLAKHAPNAGRKGVIVVQTSDSDQARDDINSNTLAQEILGVFSHEEVNLVISNYINNNFADLVDEDGMPHVDFEAGNEYMGKQFFFHPL